MNDYVGLIFENCDAMKIHKDNIGYIHLKDIVEEVVWTPSGDTTTRKVVKSARFHVEKPSKELIDRCKQYKDIVKVVLDGVHYHIQWVGDSEYENLVQNVREIDGQLYISAGWDDYWVACLK